MKNQALKNFTVFVKRKFYRFSKQKMAVEALQQKIADAEFKIKPVEIHKLQSDGRKRVSVFISDIDFNHFFGGYIGMFNFAKLFHENGYKVRIIITNNNVIKLEQWRIKILKYKGLKDIFDIFDYESIFLRNKKYEFFENEELVATSWWTANVVESIRSQLNKTKFIYLIQDFEPLFYPSGAYYSLALASYSFPHSAVFSTKFILDYFREKSLGVFSRPNEEQEAIYFENAVVISKPSNRMKKRQTKKLLFYFRPEDHAARNMFEIGFLALKKAIMEGAFNEEKWEFWGIGSLLSDKTKIRITANHDLRIIHKLDLEEYKELLPEFDVGLSLMLSPHPSLVPFEMCSAGLNVVTNSYENKTEQALHDISKNFYVAAPTVDSIKDSISKAVKNVEQYEDRIANTKIKWPASWEKTFNLKFKEKLFSLLEDRQ
ncbi:MAG: hypothetical protein H8E57_11300 [Candidatus Cloacimonetes bacterium]|nr:hypothetical protein [Candidatus Cloacimonadota bacterium]